MLTAFCKDDVAYSKWRDKEKKKNELGQGSQGRENLEKKKFGIVLGQEKTANSNIST